MFMLRFVFDELLGLLAVLGWLLLGVLFLCALPYVVRQAEGDEGAPVSGVRADCRGYVAVDPSSPEAVTSSGYAEANAL